MLIISLSRIDIALTITDAIGSVGIVIMAFVAFNWFTDGLSLLETRWVIERAATVGAPSVCWGYW